MRCENGISGNDAVVWQRKKNQTCSAGAENRQSFQKISTEISSGWKRILAEIYFLHHEIRWAPQDDSQQCSGIPTRIRTKSKEILSGDSWECPSASVSPQPSDASVPEGNGFDACISMAWARKPTDNACIRSCRYRAETQGNWACRKFKQSGEKESFNRKIYSQWRGNIEKAVRA